MNVKISKRMSKPDFQGDFTNLILTAAADPKVISFAGGLPNAVSFPIDEINKAAQKVLETNGAMALQYTGSQGFPELRQFISARYKKIFDLDIPADDIIITNGSQQALDMFASVMIDPDDEIMLEKPSYLAALQTFHLYSPKVLSISLNEDGIDCDELADVVKNHNPKFIYMIPNFQNPTGLTYTEEVREKMASILKGTDIVVLEDNPYGELRYSGTQGHSLRYFLGDQVCMLGTFSKIVSPGMRIGWIACSIPEVKEKLLAYKSAMDLHTNIFGQMVLSQYLKDNDLDAHIEKTRVQYKKKAEKMMSCMEKYFPEGTTFTKPQGGMFLWATLPEGLRAVDVAAEAIKQGVAFCAGDPFYESDRGVRTMRLNYSNSSDEAIEKGIKILGDCIKNLSK